MGVGKDRVFLLSALVELKTQYENLFKAAEQFSQEMESKVSSVRSLEAQVPSEAKSGRLSGATSGFKLEKDKFQELLQKLTRDIDKLQNDLPALDKAAASNASDLTTAANELASLFKEYQSFIQGGFTSQSVDAFKKSLSKMRLKNGMRMSAVDKTLKKVSEMSKGLAVASARYSKDPVNLTTGNFSADKEDLMIHGEVPLSFTRTYNAMDEYQGALGKNWVHPFEVRVTEEEEELKIMMEDGHVVFYEPLEDNHYRSSLFPGHRVLKDDTGYQLTTENQTQYHFNIHGQLLTKRSENGQTIQLSYNSDQRLKKAESPSGSIRFRYDDMGLLTSIKDHAKRKVTFSYKEECLTEVTLPNKAIVRYSYENGKLTTTTNPRKIDLVKNEYDYLSRITKQTFPDGGVMTYEYDDDAKTIDVTEQNGLQVTYYRDKHYRNTKVVYPNGEEITTYNEQNKPTSVTDRKGNKTQYNYDECGNLINVTNPLGEVTTMKYDAQNHPIYMKQPNGGEYKFSYENGNLIKVETPLNNSTEMKYDDQNRPVSVTQPDGSQMIFGYDERGNLTTIQYPNQGIAHYVYDAQNQVIKTTNPAGAVTTFDYDSEGNLTKVTNAEGHTREYTYNEINKVTAVKDFDGTIVTQEYNQLGKVASITNQAGHITMLEYDLMWNISKVTEPNGAETAYLYNQYNQLSQVTNAKGHAVHYDYDENQNVTSIRSPKGEETKFTYDALNRRIKMVEADGATTRYTYNKLGKIATITDALNHTTTFEYDLAGQLVRQTDALDHEITFSYTALGQVETVTDANGGVTVYDYYPGGNLKQVTYPAGETERYVYDLNDNVSEKWTGEESKITYTYDALDRVAAITNPLGHTRKFAYDAADRIVLYQDETGVITEYEYSPTGNLTLVKDALGNETRYDYDRVGNLTTIEQYGLIDPELEKVSEHNRSTQYQYDILGNVTTVTDALGNQETYAYDENNQLIKKTDKDGYQTIFDYNTVGQVQKLHYSDGKEVTMQYNALRKLEAVKDWLGTTQMKLDALGRVTEVQTPDHQRTIYGWDGQNNRTQLVYPDGKEVQYVYDPSNKLTELHTGDQVYRYHYDNQGRLIEKTLPNQVTTHYDYTPAHQLRALIHQKDQDILEQYQYQYDQAGNKQVIEKQRQGISDDSGRYEYQYDALQRLTQVTKDQELLRQYTYDAFGNRTSKQDLTGSTSYQYNALNQLVKQATSQETKQFNYDQRGNLIEELVNNQVAKSFTFDATNMMTQVMTASGEKATYQYNGLRNRVGQTIEKTNEPLKQIQYVLDLTKPYNNLLERKVNEDIEHYLWDNELLAKDNEEYFLLDDLGSPLRQLTSTGQTIDEYGYDEFGQSLFNVPTQQPFGFTGYQYDDVSGLNYAQARYYDQNQGRFLSEDPVKGLTTVPKSMNPYSYCLANPISFTDKDGRWPKWLDNTVDWLGDNVFGTNNTIEISAPKIDGGIVYSETSSSKSEKTGGEIFVANSTNGKFDGISINLPSIETPWGKFGFDGTSLGLSWGDGLSVDASASIEAFSHGINADASITLGNKDIVGVNANVGVHNENSKLGVGADIGLFGDTKVFGFGSNTDENGVTTTTKIGAKLPTWAVALIAAGFVFSPAILAAIGAAGAGTAGALGTAALLFLIFGNANSADASDCIS